MKDFTLGHIYKGNWIFSITLNCLCSLCLLCLCPTGEWLRKRQVHRKRQHSSFFCWGYGWWLCKYHVSNTFVSCSICLWMYKWTLKKKKMLVYPRACASLVVKGHQKVTHACSLFICCINMLAEFQMLLRTAIASRVAIENCHCPMQHVFFCLFLIALFIFTHIGPAHLTVQGNGKVND